MKRHRSFLLTICAALLLALPHDAPADAVTPRVKVLFLGDTGHHKPAERFAQLDPVFKQRGVDLTYTDRLTDPRRQDLAAVNDEQVLPRRLRDATLRRVYVGKSAKAVGKQEAATSDRRAGDSR